jgi:hypothetical protein
MNSPKVLVDMKRLARNPDEQAARKAAAKAIEAAQRQQESAFHAFVTGQFRPPRAPKRK